MGHTAGRGEAVRGEEVPGGMMPGLRCGQDPHAALLAQTRGRWSGWKSPAAPEWRSALQLWQGSRGHRQGVECLCYW